jgi:hypothetical protein
MLPNKLGNPNRFEEKCVRDVNCVSRLLQLLLITGFRSNTFLYLQIYGENAHRNVVDAHAE